MISTYVGPLRIGQSVRVMDRRKPQGAKMEAERDSDGWAWSDPRWRERVSRESDLALAVEALRRCIDLRDASAANAPHLTARALHLNAVLNALYEQVVVERAALLGIEIDVPHGTGAEIVHELQVAGILTAEEYRSTVAP
jgi:hypothetical protein